jgi:hypothetical protein
VQIDNDWIPAVIADAKSRAIGVPDGMWREIETYLKGVLSQRPLPPTQLAAVAMRLIQEMAPSETSPQGQSSEN